MAGVARALVGVSGTVAGAALIRRTRKELALSERHLEDLGRERDRLRDMLRKREAELSADELTLVEMHARVGAALIDELPALRDVAAGVREPPRN
jgi:hypothetical protein